MATFNQRFDKLDELHPMLREPVRALMLASEKHLGRTMLIVHSWRSLLQQKMLYEKGRTYNPTTGLWTVVDQHAKVTDTLAGAHNVITRAGGAASMAVDLIPFKADGTLDWNVSLDGYWRKLYPLAWDIGLDPLGDDIGSYLKNDLGHFEEPAWKLKLEGLGLILPAETP